MIRRYILTSILYNGGVTALLEFLVQCQDMYKDDVEKQGSANGIKWSDRFELYNKQHMGVDSDMLKKVRNMYAHALDTEYQDLYRDLLSMDISTIACICNYFGVDYTPERLHEFIEDNVHFVEGICRFGGDNGS